MITERRASWVRAVLLTLVVIIGALLGHAARWFADGMAVNAQLYFHAFRIANVHSPWVVAPLRFLSAAVLQYSALASWAFVCGYFCARGAVRTVNVPVVAFVAVALASTTITTTSVRVAQPWFFDSVVTAAVYPMVLKVLFVVIPACIAARAVFNRSALPPVLLLIAVIAIALAWWNASEVTDALTFGCVSQRSWGPASCTSREIPWGAGNALILTALSLLMGWDAVRAKRS